MIGKGETRNATGGNAILWHSLSRDEVIGELGTSSDAGLTTEKAQERLEKFGPNVLEKSSGDGVLELLWRQINDPLIYVLIVSGILAMVLGKIVDGSVVLGPIILHNGEAIWPIPRGFLAGWARRARLSV